MIGDTASDRWMMIGPESSATSIQPIGGAPSTSSDSLEDSNIGSHAWIIEKHLPLVKCVNGRRDPYSNDGSISLLGSSPTLPRYQVHAEFDLRSLVSDLIRTEVFVEGLSIDRVDSTPECISSLQLECVFGHEAAILSYLEGNVFRSSSVTSMEDIDVIELWNYCYRKVVLLPHIARSLHSMDEAYRNADTVSEKVLLLESSSRSLKNFAFRTAMAALNICRSLIEHREQLNGGLSLSKRIFVNCDFIMVLVDLLQAVPWMKLTPGECMQKFENGWQPWPEEERLCSAEGSVWIMLLHLLLYSEEVTSGRYDLSIMYRRDRLVNIKKFLSNSLKDQIPPLVSFQQFLEELSLYSSIGARTTNQPQGVASHHSHSGPLAIIEVEPTLYDRLVTERTPSPFITPITDQSQLREIASAFVEIYEEMIDGSSPDVCKENQRPQIRPAKLPALNIACKYCRANNVQDRCSGCKKVYYCSRECQVKDWPSHRENCTI